MDPSKVGNFSVVPMENFRPPVSPGEKDYLGSIFTKYDVDKDEKAHKRLTRLNGSAVIPVVLINGRKVVGFSEGKYRELLRARY